MKKWILTITIILPSLLLEAQNVGIGTTNPSRAKLEVHGVACNGNTSAVFGSDLAGLSFQRGWPTVGYNQYRDNPAGNGKFIAYGFGAFQHFDPATGTMGIDMMGGGQSDQSVGTIRRALTFNYNGQVTIGNASHNSALTVAKGNSNASAYFFGTTHHSALNLTPDEHTYIRAGKDGGTVFINDITGGKVTMSGFVGINTATPAFPLEIRQVNGKGFALIEPTYFANWDFNVYSNLSTGSSNLYLNNNGSTNKGWYQSYDGSYHHISDARLKKDIKSLSSLLEKYMKLEPVTYTMIHDNPQQKQSIGFIAQEVRQLFPELVTVTPDTASGYPGITDLHMLHYEGFSVLTIAAIREQQALIMEQKETINRLQKKLEILKKKITVAGKPANTSGASFTH